MTLNTLFISSSERSSAEGMVLTSFPILPRLLRTSWALTHFICAFFSIYTVISLQLFPSARPCFILLNSSGDKTVAGIFCWSSPLFPETSSCATALSSCEFSLTALILSIIQDRSWVGSSPAATASMTAFISSKHLKITSTISGVTRMVLSLMPCRRFSILCARSLRSFKPTNAAELFREWAALKMLLIISISSGFFSSSRRFWFNSCICSSASSKKIS